MGQMSDTPETDMEKRKAYTQEDIVPLEFARKLEHERDKYKEDLVMIVDAILKRNGRGVFDMSAIDRLAELHAAERERDEARQQEQIHYDNFLSMQKERDEAQAGYAKAERAEKMLRHAAAKADQWRECAEDFAETFAGSRPAQWARDEAYAKFEALKKAGVEAALAEFERLKEGGK